MTIQEAQLFFPFSEEDDLEDLFDERFFEYKQFFLKQPIIRKVFVAKLIKLVKMYEAYVFLIGAESSDLQIESFHSHSNVNRDFQFSDIVINAFNEYQLEKAKLLQEISRSADVKSLIEKVELLLAYADSYRLKWITDCEIDVEIESISKEPDSMELLTAIKDFNNRNGSTFSDIPMQKENLVLLKEMKRLSLLTKLNR